MVSQGSILYAPRQNVGRGGRLAGGCRRLKKIRSECSGVRFRGRFFYGRKLVSVQAEPEVEDGEGEEGADGVEQGIVGRGGAAGDEGLMDFVHDGIACGYGEGGDAPGPAPAFAIAADAAIDQETKNKIFCEVGAFADDVVNETELVFGEVREKPLYED